MAVLNLPRLAGTLVPVFALRHDEDLGIGDTRAVLDAIEFCSRQELGLLQLLPINETGGDNSPYNAISSIALDPVYISLDPQSVPGLTAEMLNKVVSPQRRQELQKGPVQYERVKRLKLEILLLAYNSFQAGEATTVLIQELEAFKSEHQAWLPTYTLFRALLRIHNNYPLWTEWASEHQTLAGAERWLLRLGEGLAVSRERDFLAYLQWVAFRQWKAVRSFAEQKKVYLVGDMPFGVSRYSADVWAERDLFDLNWSGGAPAEKLFEWGEFVRKWGQNWGIPIYNWKEHRTQEYTWWKRRIRATTSIFHAFRIDHALGFFRLYSFPWIPQLNDEFLHLSPEEAAAKTGGRVPQFLPRADEPLANACLNAADGEHLLRIIKEAAGDAAVIAEDLGLVPPYVAPVLEKLRIPGFSLPQLHIDPETDCFIPKESMAEISVATWGTHDHAPLTEMYRELFQRFREHDGDHAREDLRRFFGFVGWEETDPPEEMDDDLLAAFTRALLGSRSCWAVLTICDVLGIDMRFNVPGTTRDHNWTSRLEKPLSQYQHDPVFGPRLLHLRQSIAASSRKPV
ncbi:MAG TPA: 4-alpha-glucanotransferase [Candidatus Methylacidiphilales bacterium]|jgi:4-alpha-glucanotransferase|nr:4-alpha-glucanotransferase [Candidatus Methylacidiphilales bacterium]